jgi:hypothetical protein
MDKDTILQQWYKGIRISHRAHYEAARQFEVKNLYLGIPIIILTATSGTSILATLGVETDVKAKLLIGGLSIVASILASLQTFLRYAEMAEKHKTVATKYGILRRELDELKLAPKKGKSFHPEFLTDFRKRWDAIDEESPSIPEKIRERIAAEINEIGRAHV